MISKRTGRRRRRWTVLTLIAAACLVAATLVFIGWRSVGSPAPAATPQVVSGHGALPQGDQASCAKQYSPREVARRAFAFSGAVRSIGASRTNRKGVELPLVSATFSVDRWFSGGSGPVVTVDIADPKGRSSLEPPPFTVGTRLLVSGEHRWGEASVKDLLAWSCGFTRYDDPATAEQWRAATG